MRAAESAGGRPLSNISRCGALILLASVALVGCGSKTTTTVTTTTTTTSGGTNGGLRLQPALVTARGLSGWAAFVQQPVYWAGIRVGRRLELREDPDGSIYVRYLPRGVRAGDARQGYLTVATYPFPGALSALRQVDGGTRTLLPGGGLAVVSSSSPTSVNVAYPGVDYQVEVYDPDPAEALQVATSPRLRPVRR